ncbi:MAG: hypothetical protein HY822_15385 [Acidobacteria bacterium]|nr:hypothetical protein [Acidobacteriota bacterium]
MRGRILLLRTSATALVLSLLAGNGMAAGGGGELIVIVADSRRLSGWKAWLTNIYNESHFYFAALTITLIPLLGLFLGTLTELLLRRLGINLKSRVLAEH